jgi:hypothetical protein
MENQEVNFNFNYMDTNQKENPNQDLKQDEGTGQEMIGQECKADGTSTELENDNGVEEPLNDDEMSQLSKDKENSEKEFKFVIIGGNEPSVNDSFVKSIEAAGIPITVFELTNEEMKFIINSRAEVKAQEASVDYLQNEENKKRVNEWCKLLIQNHLKRVHKGKEFSELIQKAYDSEIEISFTKKTLKQASNLSWKQFEELFGNLELFGVIKHFEDGSFTLILNEEDVVKNQVFDFKQLLNLVIGKATSIQGEKKLSAKDKKKFESIKKTLYNVADKI